MFNLHSSLPFFSRPRHRIVLLLLLLSGCALFKSAYDVEEVELERKGDGLYASRKGEAISGELVDEEHQLGPTRYQVEAGQVKERNSQLPFHDLYLHTEWKGDSLIRSITYEKEGAVIQRKAKVNGKWTSLKQTLIEEGEPVASLQEQDRSVSVYGRIVEGGTGHSVKNAFFILRDDDGRMSAYVTDSSGSYECTLDTAEQYRLSFRKPGMSPKHLAINTEDIPKEELELGGFQMEVGITLHPDPSPELMKFLSDTILGKAEYSHKRGAIDFNTAHTRRMMSRYDSLK